MSVAIVWFRQDLRLSDNPALLAAAEYDQVIPIYIDDQTQETLLGEASRVWLHHSLAALDTQLHAHGSQLFQYQGSAESIIKQLSETVNADAVFWNRCYDPESIARDANIKAALKGNQIHASSFNASLLYEPWKILKKDESPYRVFTPFWKAMCARGLIIPPENAPQQLPPPPTDTQALQSLDVNDLGLLPTRPWAAEMMQHWDVGEQAAHTRPSTFLNTEGGTDYKKTRDLPATLGTSRLSPHLHFGEISPRQIIWQTLQETPLSECDEGTMTFIKEIGWREFAHSVMFHFPDTQQQAMYPQFRNFPWRSDIVEPLTRWQRGQTGFPIIDAGMRELWATGWMHNRVRMIVASFLTKNLLISWQDGETWFRDTLVDADLASNTLGWQWASGCGADAAPYFRIFNPVLQSQKFDADGHYIRHWVPELQSLDNKHIHQPWSASAQIRSTLNYPEPIVDLSASRQRALDAYAKVKLSQ